MIEAKIQNFPFFYETPYIKKFVRLEDIAEYLKRDIRRCLVWIREPDTLAYHFVTYLDGSKSTIAENALLDGRRDESNEWKATFTCALEALTTNIRNDPYHDNYCFLNTIMGSIDALHNVIAVPPTESQYSYSSDEEEPFILFRLAQTPRQSVELLLCKKAGLLEKEPYFLRSSVEIIGYNPIMHTKDLYADGNIEWQTILAVVAAFFTAIECQSINHLRQLNLK